MRDQGKLTDWNDDKGFGFVTPAEGGHRAFVHISAFSHRPRRPRNGDMITYQLDWDPKGRPRAVNVLVKGMYGSRDTGSVQGSAHGGVQYAMALGAMLIVIALAVFQKLSWLVPLLYISMSLILFIVYAFDKSAAMNRRWRRSEKSLHLLSLLGGWPGGLVAQSMFHHKSSKTAYRVIFFTIVFLHAALLWLVVMHPEHPILQPALFHWLRGS